MLTAYVTRLNVHKSVQKVVFDRQQTGLGNITGITLNQSPVALHTDFYVLWR